MKHIKNNFMYTEKGVRFKKILRYDLFNDLAYFSWFNLISIPYTVDYFPNVHINPGKYKITFLYNVQREHTLSPYEIMDYIFQDTSRCWKAAHTRQTYYGTSMTFCKFWAPMKTAYYVIVVAMIMTVDTLKIVQEFTI